MSCQNFKFAKNAVSVLLSYSLIKEKEFLFLLPYSEICVHTSCKSLANQCLPCGIQAFSPRDVKDEQIKGIISGLNNGIIYTDLTNRSLTGNLKVKLCQAYDLGPTSGALLVR